MKQILVEVKKLVKAMQKGFREQAGKIPELKDASGSLRISMTPQTVEADEWLGGMSTFEKRVHAGFGCITTQANDVMTYEFVSALNVGRDYGTIFEYPSSLSRTMRVQIQKRVEGGFEDFVLIYICVSGAKSVSNDTKLAKAAIEAMTQCLPENFEVVSII